MGRMLKEAGDRQSIAAAPSSQSAMDAKQRAAAADGTDRESSAVSDDFYERDFYTWTQQQAELLRSGSLDRIDRLNLLEEIETLGRAEQASLRSAYRLIALHLLKCIYQPRKATKSWRATIVRERDNAMYILEENPGLKPKRQALFSSAYRSARKEASEETGLALKVFPPMPPFTLEEVERDGYFGPDQAI